MANAAARIFLKNGKSFPQLLLRSRLVGRPSNVNEDRLLALAQPLTNQTHGLYLHRPMLADGFNFVDFVLGKDQKRPHEAEEVAREGKMRLVSRYDDIDDEEEEEEFDDDEFDDGEFDDDEEPLDEEIEGNTDTDDNDD